MYYIFGLCQIVWLNYHFSSMDFSHVDLSCCVTQFFSMHNPADDPHSSAPRMGSGSQSGPAEASSAASHGATLPFFGSLQRLHRRESKRSRGPRVAGRPNNDLCLARWGCNRSCGGVAARRHSRLGDARSQGRAARRGFYQPANSKTLQQAIPWP